MIALHDFSGTLLVRITNPDVRRIAARPPTGSPDLFSDNADLISNAQGLSAVRHHLTRLLDAQN